MFSGLQVILLTLLFIVISYDNYHTQIFVYGRTTLCGLLAGIIMGDVKTGLLVGGTLELMSLGVGAYGGSSVPNYNIGSIVGVAFAVAAGGGIEAALAVGIPTAALGVQLDVLAKMVGAFFLHKAMSAAEKLEMKKMYSWILLGTIPRVTFGGVAVLVALTAGSSVIKLLLDNMPKWLSSGLNVSGGILPAVGFGILLRYMPVKKYYVFGLLGFVLASYFKLPMIGIAIIGFIAAFLIYDRNEHYSKAVSIQGQQGGNNYDE